MNYYDYSSILINNQRGGKVDSQGGKEIPVFLWKGLFSYKDLTQLLTGWIWWTGFLKIISFIIIIL